MAYNLKIVSSGERIEIYKYTDYEIQEGNIRNAEGRRGIEGVENKMYNSLRGRKDTLRKARNNIVRLIKANSDMNTFITLTFAKEKDLIQSKKDLNIFFTKLRKVYKDLKYLWVAEYGEKNKRLHYHLLCNIPIRIKLAKTKERKSKQQQELEKRFANKFWGQGFVDIRNLRQENNTNIALYVSVYITKAIELHNTDGYRIYGYSRNLEKPVVNKYTVYKPLESVLKDFSSCRINYTNEYKINEYGRVNYIDMEVIENEDRKS